MFYASDLAAHLSGDRRTQPMNQAVSVQDLNIAMGSVAESAAAVDHIDALLREYINISYQDLAYGEVYVVPAIKAREVGLDRSMIAAYGHDDRICVYAGLRALLDMKPSARTAILMCQDKEEIGNLGNTAAASRFYSDFMAELLELQTGTGSGHLLRQVLSDTQAITGDVTFLQEPMDPSQTTAENDGISGRGVCIAPYTSSTLPQYRGGLLRLLDEKQIPWQISTGRPDRIAFSSSTGQSFSKNNIDAINVGPGLNAMHSIYELVHKQDLYSCYQAYRAFFEAPRLY